MQTIPTIDEAVAEYLRALVMVQAARNRLEKALKALDLSDELVERFILELESKPNGKKEAQPEPVRAEPSKAEPAVAKPPKQEVKPEDVKPKRRKRRNAVPVEEGQIIRDGDYFIYRVEGKLKRTKTVPLYKYGNTWLMINDAGEFYIWAEGNRGRGGTFPERLILEQLRTIMHHLETDLMEPGQFKVYESFVEYFLPKMRPLARDAFKEMLKSYRAWLRRVGGEDGKVEGNV